MIRAVPGDYLAAAGDQASDLHGALVGLRAREAEERLGQPADLGQPLAQLGFGRGHHGRSRVAELVHLALDGLEHLGVLVADVDVHDLRAEIDPLVAVAVPEPDALGLGHVDGLDGSLHRPGEERVIPSVLNDLLRGRSMQASILWRPGGQAITGINGHCVKSPTNLASVPLFSLLDAFRSRLSSSSATIKPGPCGWEASRSPRRPRSCSSQ